MLESANVLANVGSIIDASIVEVPRQRNDRDDNKTIKTTGKAPESWKDNTHKCAQKDIDARWTKKRDVTYYGYKDHIKIDSGTKLITNYTVTDASVHDSQALNKLITKKDANKDLHADSAYTGPDQEKIYEEKQVVPKINEKGYRNRPLTEAQKASNKEKSKIRARVEHVFGFMVNSMGGSLIRSIGIIRATANICMRNLTYNILRFVQIKQMKKEVFAG
jgi:IS5 family transposase